MLKKVLAVAALLLAPAAVVVYIVTTHDLETAMAWWRLR
ncbi:4-alpha-glucanotransferase [Actinokineospora baliensis]|nr:4-alpha-glucanotransferase [Actinokineospora baliensis]